MLRVEKYELNLELQFNKTFSETNFNPIHDEGAKKTPLPVFRL